MRVSVSKISLSILAVVMLTAALAVIIPSAAASTTAETPTTTAAPAPIPTPEEALLAKATAENWGPTEWFYFEVYVATVNLDWDRLRQLEDYVWAIELANAHGNFLVRSYDTSWWGSAANCVMNHENRSRIANVYYGGAPYRSQRISDAAGFFQFLSGTWNNYQGYPTAALAPPLVQLDKFNEVWNGGRGASHWAGTNCY